MGDEALGGRHCDGPPPPASACPPRACISFAVVSGAGGLSPGTRDCAIVRLGTRLAGPPRPECPGVVIVFKLKGKLDLSSRSQPAPAPAALKMSEQCWAHGACPLEYSGGQEE